MAGAWRLTPPTPSDAPLIASWARTAQEAGNWCSRPEHPFPSATVATWWETSDVQPWLLLDPDGTPVAYGELWDDDDEDDNELARLIVDPTRRRTGLGRQLVTELIALASASGRSGCFIRVAPGNDAALDLYRAAGFHEIDDATAAKWNHGQPAEYRWLELPDHRPALTP